MRRSRHRRLARAAAAAWLGAASLLSACDELPRDPRDTSGKVAGARLRVGWVAGAEPTAIERAAVEGLAGRLDAAVESESGPVHRLMADLEDGRLHLVAGELPERTPFAQQVGLSHSVGTVVLHGELQPTVIAVRSGENRFLMLLNEAIERAAR